MVSLLWRPLFVFVLQSCLRVAAEPKKHARHQRAITSWLLSFLDLGHLLSALDTFSNQKYVEKGS